MGFLWDQLFVTPPYPTASFTGQTVIVTGSNVGLGLEAARHFVRLSAAKVILAVRNTSAGEEAKKNIESTTKRTGVVEVWPLDLSSYESVKQFAHRASALKRLDVLLENAALATPNFVLAEENERTITVNIVSTILLAILLLPKLKSTSSNFNTAPRLTFVSSGAHLHSEFPERNADHTFDTLSDEKTANMGERYPTSKLVEIIAIRAIASQMKDSGIILNMPNPGLCHSSLSREANWRLEVMKFFLARRTEVGSRTLVAAAAAGKESHGSYMSNSVVHDDELSELVTGKDGKMVQEKIWKELSEKLERIQPEILRNLN